MSRHTITIVYRGTPIKVTVGYSRNLRRVFIETEPTITIPKDNLVDEFAMLVGVLSKEQVRLPKEMILEVLEDVRLKIGKKVIEWTVTGDVVDRKVIFEKKAESYACGTCHGEFPDAKMQWCNTADNLICDTCCMNQCARGECTDPECCTRRIEQLMTKMKNEEG